MENREIERKFLVNDNSYRKSAYTHYDIIQGYICKEPGRTIRIRLRTDADGTQQAYILQTFRLSCLSVAIALSARSDIWWLPTPNR